MTRANIIWFVALLVVVSGVSTCASVADECPPERPIAKRVYGFPGQMQMCTLLACLRLHCPPNGDCIYVADGTCNTCTSFDSPQAIDICLSRQELDEAMRIGK